MIDLALPCPFCGHPVDLQDADTLYPTGMAWRYEGSRRKYFRLRSRDEQGNVKINQHDGKVWGFHCVETSGGCGALVQGDTESEAISKWQTRQRFDYTAWK